MNSADEAKLIGRELLNLCGNSLGTVLSFFHDGTTEKITFVVVGFGGFMGIGDHKYAIPIEAVKHYPIRKVLQFQLSSFSDFRANAFPETPAELRSARISSLEDYMRIIPFVASNSGHCSDDHSRPHAAR